MRTLIATMLLLAPLGAKPPVIPPIQGIPVPSQLANIPAQAIQLKAGEWFEAFLVVQGPHGPVVCFSTTDVRPSNPGRHTFRSANGAPVLVVRDPSQR